jgi:hypothetical protein
VLPAVGSNTQRTSRGQDQSSDLELWCKAAAAACTGSNLLLCSLADKLVDFAGLQLTGPWHTLPDLITCLVDDQFVPEDGEDEDKGGVFGNLAKKAGRSLLQGMMQARPQVPLCVKCTKTY